MQVIFRKEILQGDSPTLLARVRDNSGNYVTRSELSSITAYIYKRSDGTLVSTNVLSVAGTVFDTLQTDARWTADATGYNFALTLDGTNFPMGGITYRVEVKATPVSGSVFYIGAWDLQAAGTYTD